MADTFYVFNQVPTSYAHFNRLVHGRAQELRSLRGGVIGLWADHDPDYIINLFALWQVGAVPLLLSRRLPWATVAALLEAAEATALLTPQQVAECKVPVLSSSCAGAAAHGEEGPVTAAEIGSPARTLAVILHTSGTTHLPKLVPFTRANLEASLGFLLDRWKGLWTERDATLGSLPLFHGYGLISELLCCYRLKSRYHFCGANPHEILHLLQAEPGRITILFTVPWMLEQLLDDPAGLPALQKLRYIITGGAVLREDIGNLLSAQGVQVVQNYGMTEIGCTFLGPLTGGDFRDLYPVIPSSFWHIEEDSGMLFIHAECPTLSPAHRRDFSTQDVFLQTAAGGYRHQCRKDDILVHANGEKSNAIVIEQMLLSRLRHLVDLAAVVGSGRLHLACLLQLKRDPQPEDQGEIFATLERINADLPGHSRLHKDMVLLLAPSGGKRLPVTPKGSVMRKKAEQEFRAELEERYSGAVQDPVGSSIESFFPHPEQLDRHVSLFLQGMDSLKAVSLRNHIARLYPDRQIPQNIVYQHPTLVELQKHLLGEETQTAREPPVFPAYGPAEVAAARFAYPAPRHVLLTGGTGFVGQELLQALIESRDVQQVHCLVRKEGAGASPHPKVRYHGGYSLTDPQLGLSPREYAELSRQVDTVVHAAWPIEFNSTYDQLADTTLSSVRHMIEFARQGDKTLHFLSTIATVMLHPSKRRVDEEWPSPTPAACLPHGYAQTKWEAEHLILRSGVRHKIFRLGQISAHRVTGRWNNNEHLPILLQSSRALGSMPLHPLPVDWVPVDVACRALVELMTVPMVNIHHIANPHARPSECLAQGLRSLSLPEWMVEVEPHLEQHPRLLAIWPFLHELVEFGPRISSLDATATCSHSPTLASCEAINDEYILRVRNQGQPRA